MKEGEAARGRAGAENIESRRQSAKQKLKEVTRKAGSERDEIEKQETWRETQRDSLHHIQRMRDLQGSTHIYVPTIVILSPGNEEGERFKRSVGVLEE